MPVQREDELRKDLTAKLNATRHDQEERLAQERAATAGLPYISLSTFPLDADVLELLPRTHAQTARAVLFYRQGKDIRLAVVNPTAPALSAVLEYLNQKLHATPELYVISDRSFTTTFARYRRETERVAAPSDELKVDPEQLDTFAAVLADLKQLEQHIAQRSPTELLTTLVAGAVKVSASDIHLEPQASDARLRYRVDGVLQDISTIPRSGWRLLLSRVKVLASLKLNVHDVPQDGSFVVRIGPKTYDIRVSTLPGGEGENVVMRILDRASQAHPIIELGMKERDIATIREQLKASNGMILVTGPTGSGKTTTLASFLQEISTPDVKAITLEDPIEYRLTGVEQTQVDADAGYTFALGLRAILRQDPDIIMVGEIRDTETAETALHASLTGHLVLSTLHTNNAPGAIPRLLDMGIAANIIAPAINIIIAQRLVRVVCVECATEYQPDQALREHIADSMQGVQAAIFDRRILQQTTLRFKQAHGCSSCHQTGYRGRVGLFEVMPVTGDVEELVLAEADSNKILTAALQDGMTTITQDGYLKVIAGITTIEEVKRVTEE